ncbi:MAG TPA: DUF4105 domain-containing protein [Pseudobdellovibrionaceae bacterium]|jgi:hypothetical protein
MKTVIALLFIFFSLSPLHLVRAETSAYTQALQKAHELGLAQEPQWLLLGHYKKNLLNQWKSDISDPNFFISPEGATNPSAELDSLLASLWSPANEKDMDQDPRCRFPARLSWLKKNLRLEFPEEEQDPLLQRCRMYLRYRSVIKAHSLSFVFSSYYANSPGSAFGHTFFRINKKPGPDGSRSELLDHGVGYAAQVTVTNPMLYAFFGLAGVFKGVFTNLPYYYKVREYNDFESRDLWSYDLNLTPEEVDMVARHLWEVGNSYFDYYFLTQNCAYHMLTVLEAAAPRYRLSARVPYYVIPSDTIKAITAEPGLVKEVHFRPALRSVFTQRYDRLSTRDQAIFRAYMKDLDLSILLAEPEMNRVILLDTALDYMDMIYPENLVNPLSEGAKKKNTLLQARASIAVTSKRFEAKLPENERPDLGHNSARAAIGFGRNYLGNSATTLEFRFALHDLLDSHTGYPENSQLEFGHLRGQVDRDLQQARLDDFDIFRVTAMNPLSLFSNKLSWRVHVGVHRFKEGACEKDCLTGGLGFGAGYAHYLDHEENLLLYGLLESEAYYDVHFKDQPYKVAVGPTLGLLAKIGDQLKWSVEDTYLFQTVRAQSDDHKFSTELRYLAKHDWNLGLRYNHEIKSDESFLMVYRFF